MDWTLHNGITEDPNSTLPNGQAETAVKDVLLFKVPLRDIWNQLAFKAYRKKYNDIKNREIALRDEKGHLFLLDLIKEIIDKTKENQTVIAVLAPWKEDRTLSKSEGYIRRIKEIDETVLKNCFCVYLYECPYYKVNRIIADRVTNNRIYIRYNTEYRFQREFVEEILEMCDWCYSHSVLRMIPAFHPEESSHWLKIFNTNTKHILDIHGATEEEAVMVGDEKSVPYIKKSEEKYFSNIDYAISLTGNMEEYYAKKYGRKDIHYFRTPVISRDISNRGLVEKTQSYPLAVVYSGGCQKWQNIDLMVQIIKTNLEHVEYHIFVSEPDKFERSWGGDPIPPNVHYKNGTADEISGIYRIAHAGFILRDDNALNRVACPTKLMEYLQFGIVPIVLFDDIGGMSTIGMKSISSGTNLTNVDLKVLEEYASQNFHIVNQLIQQNKDNINQLITLFEKGSDL